jgi:H/ACA ribonucleoprotein complex subunit 2
MGKDKKSKKDKVVESSDEEQSQQGGNEDRENRLFVSPIADPMASDKLTKKVLKLIKKGMKDKLVRRGVKETVKAVRKGQNKGLVIIAADISPIDVLSHLPLLCEEKGIPYVYVRSRAEVGEACKTKRPTSCVMI